MVDESTNQCPNIPTFFPFGLEHLQSNWIKESHSKWGLLWLVVGQGKTFLALGCRILAACILPWSLKNVKLAHDLHALLYSQVLDRGMFFSLSHNTKTRGHTKTECWES